MSDATMHFDKRSGNWLERAVFNHRALFLAACLLLTLMAGWAIRQLHVNAAFDRMIPPDHPAIQNYFEARGKLGGLGNTLRVVIENPQGDIYDARFLDTTRQINDKLFLLPGVDRPWMKSIWMSSVRWTEVTEEGFRGGTVMPGDYNGSPESLDKLRTQVRTAGLVGTLVANDARSIMIVVPLLERNPETGAPLDYAAFSDTLEREIRQPFEAGANGRPPVKVHVVGFAKLAGELLHGLSQMVGYFAVSAIVAALLIFWYTRCVRSTVLVVGCSMVAVLWGLGAIAALGYELDPYSVLVPFLVFAIGVSHGAQKMNGIMQDVGRGADSDVAARLTFRRLFMAGFAALLADAVGFAILMVIHIPVIQQLAITASIGVAVLVVTNLLLLPVLLCDVGVSRKAAARSIVERDNGAWAALVAALSRLTAPRPALLAIGAAAVLAVAGYALSLRLQVGDLDPGAPELRKEARYNRDVDFINAHFGLSSDQFIVLVKTPPDGCSRFKTLRQTERLAALMRETPGVTGTAALPDSVAAVVAGLNEGNPKWISVSRNARLTDGAAEWILTDSPDMADKSCSLAPLTVFLADHKAATLKRVVAVAEEFAREQNDADAKFLLAAGPAGIEAVTNEVVESASRTMLLFVYCAVSVLCLITFRSWRAVLVAMLPLALTSILCEALMVTLGMGVKVATLPVIALGVGIGVDYSLYLLSVQLNLQRAGRSLQEAYAEALRFTGRVVALVGVTLAAGVITWIWSPIKFQADMGVLLTFMFLWNMVGALVLIPALSRFLLPTHRVRAAPGAAPLNNPVPAP